MFLGIRCGKIWGRDVTKQVDDAKFIDGLKRVADADQVMDTANPDVELLQAMVKINDRVPYTQPETLALWEDALRKAGLPD